jgi:hypothetical protein
MNDADVREGSEFQRTLALQIATYEADLEGLRSTGGEADEISTFETIVGELRRLQLEDLAELARAADWRSDRVSDQSDPVLVTPTLPGVAPLRP